MPPNEYRNGMKQMVVVVPPDIHERFKAKATRRGLSMQTILDTLVRDWLEGRAGHGDVDAGQGDRAGADPRGSVMRPDSGRTGEHAPLDAPYPELTAEPFYGD